MTEEPPRIKAPQHYCEGAARHGCPLRHEPVSDLEATSGVSLFSLRGIAPNATGDKDSVAFVRALRDGPTRPQTPFAREEVMIEEPSCPKAPQHYWYELGVEDSGEAVSRCGNCLTLRYETVDGVVIRYEEARA